MQIGDKVIIHVEMEVRGLRKRTVGGQLMVDGIITSSQFLPKSKYDGHFSLEIPEELCRVAEVSRDKR